MLYVYALFGDEPRRLPDGMRVRRCGGLFAAVSEIAERPKIREQALREHEQTVRALAECVDAILPARFGAVVEDEETLASLLREREPEFCQALTMVKGCEQMTLRVYGEIPPTPPQPAEVEGLGPGARYLAGKVRESAVPGLDAIRPALLSFIRAEHVQRHNAPPLLASVYHLIERGHSAGYMRALDGSRDTAPVRFAASGPWPPYAFGGMQL